MDDTLLHEILMAQGRMGGQLDAIDQRLARIEDRLDGFDGRLRHVEQKAATAGVVAGVVTALGVGVGVEVVKKVMGA